MLVRLCGSGPASRPGSWRGGSPSDGTLERPKLGIFDGLKITIDPVVDFEMQCFLVLHLFGHSVQWVAPLYRPEILGVSDSDLEIYLDVLEAL